MIDTGRKMRLLRLVEARASDYVGRYEELKYLLAPMLAQNAGQQRRFYEIFDAFVAECEQEALPQLTKPTWWQRNRTSLLLTLLASILLVMVAWGISEWLKPEQQVAVPVKIQVYDLPALKESDSLMLANATTLQEGIDFRWEIRDAETRELLFESEEDTLRWVPDPVHSRGPKLVRLLANGADTTQIFPLADSTTLSVICQNPPDLSKAIISPQPGETLVQGETYDFRLSGMETDSLTIQWIFPNGDTIVGPVGRHTFGEAASQANVRLRVIRGEHCRSEKYLSYSLGANKPFLRLLPLEEIEPERSHQYNFWYWLLILLPLALLPWLYRRWRRQFDREPQQQMRELTELEAEYPVHDLAPYYIPYRDRRNLIRVPAQFFRIADVLRRREEGLRREFDSKASITATVQSGGYPSWRDRHLSRPAAYLVLCQWHDERHQMDRLLGRLVTFLEEQDAPVQLLWHDGSFERVWETGGESTILSQWHRNHPGHRLIILGDGLELVNQTQTPAPMLVQRRLKPLLQWERRLLLTTRPTADWNWQEALLYQHFHLFPVTTEGILEGVEQLDRLEEVQPGAAKRDFEEKKIRYPEASLQYRLLDTVEDLRDWLSDDPELFRWLCGLAVTNHPDWSLTIAIGQALGVEVTHDRLLRLARIPWLAENAPSNHLRLDLLRQLSEEDTQLARQCLIDELEAVKEQVQGGFAEVEWTTTLAVQRFALDPRLPEHKQQIRELQQIGFLDMEQEAELEFVLTEAAHAGKLSGTAKEGLQAWLDEEEPQEPIRWITRESIAAMLLVLLSLVGGIYGLSYNLSDPQGPPKHVLQSEEVVADSLNVLLNEAIRLSASRDSVESWSQWLAQEDSFRRVVNKVQAVMNARNDVSVDSLRSSIDQLEQEPLYNDTLREELVTKATTYIRSELHREDSALFAILYNYKVKAFNFFLADSADLMTDLRNLNIGGDTIFRMQAPGNAPFYLHSQHLRGLFNYYISGAQQNEQAAANLMDSARSCYERIVGDNQGYFDSLKQAGMLVNLETLLAEVPVDSSTVQNVFSQIEELLRNVQQDFTDGGDLQLIDYLRIKEADTKLERPGLRQLSPGLYRDLRILADQLMEELIARLEISGTVTDPAGHPLPEIVVSYWSGNSTTDAYGAFSMEVYPEDPWDETVALLLLGDGADRKDTSVTIRTLIIGKPIHISMTVPEDAPAVTEPADLYPLLDEALKLGRCSTVDSLIRVLEQWGADKLAFYRGQREEACGGKIDLTSPILPQLVSIPGGTFWMGDNSGFESERPMHQVQVSTFSLSKYEVTNAEFARFLNTKGNQEEGGGTWYDEQGEDFNGYAAAAIYQNRESAWEVREGRENHPVNYVSWYGARAYCAWLSEVTGDRYRLPCEAEWEYAAGGGTAGRDSLGYRLHEYSGSSNVDEVAWFGDNSRDFGTRPVGTRPVGTKAPNELGLYDMSGNVWEWCADPWHENYDGAPETARAWTDGGNDSRRVLRGGSWGGTVGGCRVAHRGWSNSNNRDFNDGFRVVRY